MNLTHPIASVAELLGEPARCAMLIALLSGKDLTAGDLARAGGTSPQSASAHLSKLVDGGLLQARSEGRNRYYRISRPEVVHALEALGAISTHPFPSSLVRTHGDTELCRARSCYDHLAGQLGVAITKKLEDLKVIRPAPDRDYAIGSSGLKWFAALNIDAAALQGGRRMFARRCLDWTERKPHLAGALGAAFFDRMLASGWLARRRGTRALRVTEHGVWELKKHLGVGAWQ
jgi:DNA-binding transcriptional ArsR family regulator